MNEAPLHGRVALVTGGSGAIGREIVEHLRVAGATAVSLDVRSASDGHWIETDVRQDQSVARAVGDAERRFGGVDVLVHAAGVSHDAVVWKMPVDEWDRIHSVNLRGAFLLLHHAIPALRKRGGGAAVLVGSINGSRGKFGTSAYSASKAGLIGLMRSVARETGRFGIRVNVIEPGWVKTPLTEAVPKEVVDSALAESLLGTLLDAADVARAVLFLASPEGKSITGQVLRVDGGQYLGGW